MAVPHPLQHLNKVETELAVSILREAHPGEVIEFRQIGLQEPAKAELLAFLDLEHAGKVDRGTKRPKRLATCQYDTITSAEKGVVVYNEAVVDLDAKERVSHQVVPMGMSPSLTVFVHPMLAYS